MFHIRNFGIEDGLSDTEVYAVLEDREGFLWVGTASGLHRFDGEEWVIYRHDPDDDHTLGSNLIGRLFEDSRGDLWIVHEQGVDRYQRRLDRFIRYTGPTQWPVVEDEVGAIWCVDNGKAFRLDVETGVWTPHETDMSFRPLKSLHPQRIWFETGADFLLLDAEAQRFDPVPELRHLASSHSIGADDGRKLWLTGPTGYRVFDTRTRALEDHPSDLSFSTFLRTASGEIWGADGAGLFYIDPTLGSATRIPRRTPEAAGLSSNSVNTLWAGRHGVLWVATHRGLDQISPWKGFSARRVTGRAMAEGLSSGSWSGQIEDHRGNLWVGLENGLDVFSPEGGRKTWRHEPTKKDSLPSGPVSMVFESSSERVWVGTWYGGGLARYEPTTDTFSHVDVGEIGIEHVQSMLEDSSHRLWIGALPGLAVLHADQIESPDRAVPERVHLQGLDNPPMIYSMAPAPQGQIWIPTYLQGLVRFDPQSREAEIYRYDPRTPAGRCLRESVDVHAVEEGAVWIAGATGLCRFDPAQETFTSYGVAEGLPAPSVTNIVAGAEGTLWLSSGFALSRLDTESGLIQSFDADDGLLGGKFPAGGGSVGHRGRLHFLSTEGTISFLPRQVRVAQHLPDVVLTDFKLLRKSSRLAWDDPESPLMQAIRFADEVVLNHRQNLFGFEFAAPDFQNSKHHRYAYRLDPYDSGWIEADEGRDAEYSNIPPGRYVFRVRVGTDALGWNEDEATVRVVLEPAPWRTWWAYGSYLTIALFLVGTYLRRQQARLQEVRERAQQAEQVSAKLRRLDRVKDEILANTSHELRTPLFGMTGLAESLIDGARGDIEDGVREDLRMIVRSGKRLSAMVDDILDVAQLRRGGLELRLSPLELRSLVDIVLTLNKPLVGAKSLELRNAVSDRLPLVDADSDRVQQVLDNLVANAIKFTHEGTIVVDAELGPDGEHLVVSVADTGPGIAELELIFESFVQADGAANREFGGTGLGLAISRRLIDLHGGRIWAESTVGEGATFFFSLPIANGDEATARPAPNEGAADRLVLDLVGPGDQAQGPGSRKPDVFNGRSPSEVFESDGDRLQEPSRVLIVDDEPIVREVLNRHLAAHGYITYQASNGEHALRHLEQEDVDLVLLDVMMPRMSGFEVCRSVRERQTMEELPVLLLSAKTQIESVTAGFAEGANDYLTKPIDRSELLARVRAHLALLELYRLKESEVKELKGLLPICCSCKKIRDDEGYWNQVEIYISARSEAHFSHGICPTCLARTTAQLEL